jgi:hypothetical protein
MYWIGSKEEQYDSAVQTKMNGRDRSLITDGPMVISKTKKAAWNAALQKSDAHQTNIIVERVFIKRDGDCTIKTTWTFKPKIATMVMTLSLVLLSTAILGRSATAEPDRALSSCYAKCYERAKPCRGRADCNRKSGGCYDDCDLKKTQPQDPSSPPLVACQTTKGPTL